MAIFEFHTKIATKKFFGQEQRGIVVMNERIKELAVQADLLIKKTNGDEFRYGNFDPKFQKFAELIIRECIKQAHGVADLRGVNDDMVYGADTAAVRIHRYFGVKE
jgi:hypothetical protein